MINEVWKDIPGFEGKYQASSYGNIRSVDRSVAVYVKGKSTTRRYKGYTLRPGKYCKSGHVSVVLGSRTNGRPVHQLVAITFLGPTPNNCEVRHMDGNPTNNRLDNLQYGTRRENILDVFTTGKPWRKLTSDEAAKIKKRLSEGEKGSVLAKEFGVSQTSISYIKKGRTFSWLK